jgi:hypothetical protein
VTKQNYIRKYRLANHRIHLYKCDRNIWREIRKIIYVIHSADIEIHTDDLFYVTLKQMVHALD